MNFSAILLQTFKYAQFLQKANLDLDLTTTFNRQCNYYSFKFTEMAICDPYNDSDAQSVHCNSG